MFIVDLSFAGYISTDKYEGRFEVAVFHASHISMKVGLNNAGYWRVAGVVYVVDIWHALYLRMSATSFSLRVSAVTRLPLLSRESL